MRDGEVRRENRHGIAEDQETVSAEDPLLVAREMSQAEETGSLLCVLFGHSRRAALDPSGIVLEADRKSPAGQIPFPDLLERFIAFAKILPGLSLLRQELEAEAGKTLQASFSAEASVGLQVKNGIKNHGHPIIAPHPIPLPRETVSQL